MLTGIVALPGQACPQSQLSCSLVEAASQQGSPGKFPCQAYSQPRVLHVSVGASAQLTPIPAVASRYSILALPGLYPILAVTCANVCCRLAQPSLSPDPAHMYANRCCSLAWSGLTCFKFSSSSACAHLATTLQRNSTSPVTQPVDALAQPSMAHPQSQLSLVDIAAYPCLTWHVPTTTTAWPGLTWPSPPPNPGSHAPQQELQLNKRVPHAPLPVLPSAPYLHVC